MCSCLCKAPALLTSNVLSFSGKKHHEAGRRTIKTINQIIYKFGGQQHRTTIMKTILTYPPSFPSVLQSHCDYIFFLKKEEFVKLYNTNSQVFIGPKLHESYAYMVNHSQTSYAQKRIRTWRWQKMQFCKTFQEAYRWWEEVLPLQPMQVHKQCWVIQVKSFSLLAM